ncbi:MAG: hypothetical protein CM15mP49_05810 [Actinomycetota bacterium]|nr:MAG: hypothetical protein CM15mP49_05810 [Actinomycetota bacterium]
MTIQVLVQSRPELIDRTFESIAGAKTQSSISTIRHQLFNEKLYSDLIATGLKELQLMLRDTAKALNQLFRHEHQVRILPESFTGTELDFAKEICDAVVDVIDPSLLTKSSSIYLRLLKWPLRTLTAT